MSVEYHGLRFERPGHATVRIETAEGRILYVDPWSQVIDGEPGDADVVFVTHDDPDHYDPDAIEAVAGPGATVAVYEAVDASDLDRAVVALPYDGTATVDGIEVRTLPAYNRADGDHVDDEGDPFHAEREVIGLLLTLGDVTVYYPSDTDFLDAHAEVRADVFLPPIGGHYTMDRREAAAFAESVDPDLVLPLHYDTFEPIETDAEAFAEEVRTGGRRVELF